MILYVLENKQDITVSQFQKSKLKKHSYNEVLHVNCHRDSEMDRFLCLLYHGTFLAVLCCLSLCLQIFLFYFHTNF